MKQKRKIFLILLPILALTVLFCSAQSLAVNFSHTSKNALLTRKKAAAWKALSQAIKKEMSGFRGEAGLVIEDLSSGWQIVHNPNKLFPSASLAKIPIMASCFHAASAGELDLKEKISLKDSDKAGGSGILKYFARGSKLSVEELIELMITRSDNTAANMLIELLDFDYLNNSFKKLGLKYTNLKRKMMDFSRRRQGVENFTTAAEMSAILEKFYRREFIDGAASERCLGLLNHQKIRDRIPAKLPAGTPVAHKTGLEKGICHDAGIVFTKNGDFLICVLTSHRNKTARPAKKFIAEVAFLTYNYYRDEHQ
jgi:beta-lactamase class A